MQSLEKFKKTELGEIPEDWSISKLDDISELFVPMRDKPKEFDGDIPWLRIEDLDGKFASDSKSNQRVSKETVKKMNLRIYPRGTILCSCSATIGVCAITTRELITNQTFIGIYPRAEVDNVFLYYFLLTQKNNLVKIGSGSTIPYISREKFENFPIILPKRWEQQKITSILSKVDELIQKTDQIIEQTRRLKKGLMQRLLIKGIGHSKFKNIHFYDKILSIPETWKVEELGTYTTKIGSGITPRGGSKVYLDEGIPLIRSQNVHFDGLKLDDVAYISEKIDEEMKNSRTQVGDVLLNITGASVGRCTFVPLNLKRGNVNQHVCIVRPNSEINSIFLTIYLSSNIGQKIIHRSYHGLSREGLTFSQIASIKILVPILEEQKKIAGMVNSVDSLIGTNILNKQKFEILKRGLMQKLLTGKIRVKV